MGSEPEQQQKLTKKQRKALAFREKKSGKGKGKARPEPSALPELDEQELPELDRNAENLDPEIPFSAKAKGKRKSDENETTDEVSDKKVTKKRKREEDTHSLTNPEEKEAKTDENANVGESKRKKAKKEKEEDSKSKARYILFVGNLRYTTTKEAIHEHFSVCDPPPQIRLLSPKPKSSSSANVSASSKSKGCAFLEFSHRNALQQALKLHHSTLDGRRINVELSAGGGGSGESRITKIRARNKELANQRAKRIQKEKPDADSPSPSDKKAERHSSTAGTDATPVHKRTWTIPNNDEEDDGRTHRGGVKHSSSSRRVRGPKKGGKQGDGESEGSGGASFKRDGSTSVNRTRKAAKTWGTGVNAIPVG